MPLLTAGEPLGDAVALLALSALQQPGGRGPGGAIRDGSWKLIEDYGTGRRELFDLAHDVKESTNLADAQPSRVDDLAAKLAAWRESVEAQMPTPNPDYTPNPQAAGGVITLPARFAEVHGTMLRYEPLPHKNTLGFWTRADDWASWEFVVKQPGEFAVRALVGCGKGSGGSAVEFRWPAGCSRSRSRRPADSRSSSPRLGKLTLGEAGRYRLEVRSTSKPLAAVDGPARGHPGADCAGSPQRRRRQARASEPSRQYSCTGGRAPRSCPLAPSSRGS